MSIPAPRPDPAVTEAIAAINDRTPIVMLIGRAGAGKSHFIRSLADRRNAPQPMLWLATDHR